MSSFDSSKLVSLESYDVAKLENYSSCNGRWPSSSLNITA